MDYTNEQFRHGEYDDNGMYITEYNDIYNPEYRYEYEIYDVSPQTNSWLNMTEEEKHYYLDNQLNIIEYDYMLFLI